MTGAQHQLMRRANVRFAAALDKGDVQAALEADDTLHDVAIEATGNRVIAQTIERQLPLIRRLERLRFGSLLGRRSIAWHDQLIDACEERDVESAVAITTRIWSALLANLEADGAEGGTRDDDLDG
jgi:DNA-binding GntR family transcriptional regulator